MAVLITGVCGQDGSYLAEQLVAVGKSVVGMILPGETKPAYIEALQSTGACELVSCDLADPASFRMLLRQHMPERVFHLAAMSNPQQCVKSPTLSRAVNVISAEVIYDWARRDRRDARVLLVSSAAIFGIPEQSPQNESTPTAPLNEYGRQKLVLRELAATARDDDLHFACAIPFHHESPRRPVDYVFAKICHAAVQIARGEQHQLNLGNTSVSRDWGYAPEFITAMAWMLDVDSPTDLVLATGESHSVDELVTAAFAAAGVDPADHVTTDQSLLRVDDPVLLQGDAEKAWDDLGWEATTKFQALVELMVTAAMER